MTTIIPFPQDRSFNDELIAALPCLRKRCLAMTKDFDRASDLVQDTAEKALANRDRFQLGTNMAAWLCLIARNLFLMDRRKAWRRVDGFEGLALGLAASDDHGAALLAKEALGALTELPQPISDALVATGWHGLKQDEYAHQAGISLATAKRRLSEGRAQLQARWA